MALTDKQIRELGLKPEDVKNTSPGGGIADVSNVRLNKLGKSGLSFANALDLLLPGFTDTVTGQLGKTDAELLASAMENLPGFAQLQRDIALGDAETTRQIYEGDLGAFETGATAVDRINRSIDPEFFSTRTSLANALQEILAPGLTGGERSEVERSLGRSNAQSGNLPGTGSNLNTVSNAMTFGSAARNRLADAISRAGAVLPQLRTGAAAPGGISATPGTKVQTPTFGQAGLNIAQNLGGALGNNQSQQMAAHLAPQSSDLERGVGLFSNMAGGFNSLTSGLGNLFSFGASPSTAVR